jgi:hypothetical protein
VNTSDPDVGVISHDVTFLQDVEIEKQRISLFRAKNEMDFKLEHQFFSTTIDTCKFLNGMTESLFSRVVSQDFFNSLGGNLSCPFKKGLRILSTNNTYSDFLLPPVPDEMRFRIEKIGSGFIKKTKKWIKMYSFQLYAIVKK